jgi:hypothetical protein
LTDRKECEEREMAACLALAREACIKFSKDKCLVPFQDARILKSSLLDCSDCVCWDPKRDHKLFGHEITEIQVPLKEIRGNFEGSYYRGVVFLASSVEDVDARFDD